MPVLRVFRVLEEHNGVPIGPPRSELGETVPRHADCLRYDCGFHDPQDPSRVIFPVFHGRGHVNVGGKITHDRWRSFGLKLEPLDAAPQRVGDWITYVDCQKHEPITLAEWMKSQKLTALKSGVV